MQKNNRNAVGIAALLYINRMLAAGFQEKCVVGGYFRIQGFHGLSGLKFFYGKILQDLIVLYIAGKNSQPIGHCRRRN